MNDKIKSNLTKHGFKYIKQKEAKHDKVTHYFRKKYQKDSITLLVSEYSSNNKMGPYLKFQPQQAPVFSWSHIKSGDLEAVLSYFDRLKLNERSFLQAQLENEPAFAVINKLDSNYFQRYSKQILDVFLSFPSTSPQTTKNSVLFQLKNLPKTHDLLSLVQQSNINFNLTGKDDINTAISNIGNQLVKLHNNIRWNKETAFLSALKYGAVEVFNHLNQMVATNDIKTERIMNIVFDIDFNSSKKFYSSENQHDILYGAINKHRKDQPLYDLALLHPLARWMRSHTPKTYWACFNSYFDQLSRFPLLVHVRSPVEALHITSTGWETTFQFIRQTALIDSKDLKTIINFYEHHNLTAQFEGAYEQLSVPDDKQRRYAKNLEPYRNSPAINMHEPELIFK